MQWNYREQNCDDKSCLLRWYADQRTTLEAIAPLAPSKLVDVLISPAARGAFLEAVANRSMTRNQSHGPRSQRERDKADSKKTKAVPIYIRNGFALKALIFWGG
jgi:hypothetical protein